MAAVKWVRRQRETRIAAVVVVLEKVRQAGYTEGYRDGRHDLGPEEPRTEPATVPACLLPGEPPST